MVRREITKNKFLWALLLLGGLSMFAAGCGMGLSQTTYPHRKGRPTSGKSYVIKGERYHILASARGFVQRGVASWYGARFHGRKTANGETYNMHALTAAHKTLPMNTWVKVTNRANNREVTVRINDRGPFAKARIIDLSYASARMIGIVDSGTAPVRIEALGTAKKRKVGGRVESVLVQPRSYEEGSFTVQVGSFKKKANAQALAGRLRQEYGRVFIQVFDRGDAVFHRVQVAEVGTIGQAHELQERLEKQGHKGCFVVAR